MNLLTIKLKGVLRHSKYYIKGYIDLEDLYTNIIYTQYYLFGCVLIYQKIVFTETIPNWVIRKLSTLGYHEWNSSRPFLIDAATKKRIIKTYHIM